MRDFELFDMGMSYFRIAIIVVIVQFLIMGIGVLILKKRRKKQLDLKRIIWWDIYLVYLFVVLGVTLIDRGGFWENRRLMPLFYSYRDAWYNFSIISWRNIILNILMFVPFGFLLPMGIKKMRRFWKTYLAAFGFTVFIELIQLLFHRGVFEPDDIMNNTMGAMIGYGCYVLMDVIISCIAKRKWERKWIAVVALQIPLIITVMAFSILFIVYQRKELGNNPETWLMKQNMKHVQMNSEIQFSTKETKMGVYQIKTLSKKETETVAEEFFKKNGTELDSSRNDYYEENAIYHSKDGMSLWVYYTGEIDFCSFGDEDFDEKVEVDEESARKAVESYGFEISENASFEKLENNRYQFTVDMQKEGNSIVDGCVNCTFQKDGKCSDIRYSIKKGELYKQYPVLSEQQAYDLLCSGKFQYYKNHIQKITVKDCCIKYVLDSKGFYQPTYQFGCKIDGKDFDIHIPAINS